MWEKDKATWNVRIMCIKITSKIRSQCLWIIQSWELLLGPFIGHWIKYFKSSLHNSDHSTRHSTNQPILTSSTLEERWKLTVGLIKNLWMSENVLYDNYFSFHHGIDGQLAQIHILNSHSKRCCQVWTNVYLQGYTTSPGNLELRLDWQNLFFTYEALLYSKKGQK